MKTQRIWIALLGAAVLVLSGCAGTNFTRPADEEMRLGATTYDQVIARFGTPFREGSQTIDEKELKGIAYAYASVGGAAAVEGITPARSMGFYFDGDVMIGREFLSSFKEDSTLFDEGLAKKLKKGQSRAQVLKVAGRPHGEYTGPLAGKGAKHAYLYLYQHARGFDIYQRKLLVSFDKSDKVVEVAYTTAGKF